MDFEKLHKLITTNYSSGFCLYISLTDFLNFIHCYQLLISAAKCSGTDQVKFVEDSL